MTYGFETAFISGARFFRLAVVASLLVLGGCGGGNTVESAVPVSQGARDTGTFPNLNIKPQVAAEQFTDTERDAKLGQLKAQQAQAAAIPGGTTGTADAAALNKLAATHADDTLKQIEGKCDPALDPTCK